MPGHVALPDATRVLVRRFNPQADFGRLPAKAARWTIEEIEPATARSELVDFFWEQRHWPYPTREDYLRAWDWRYASLGDEKARVWIARTESGEILGHLAVYPRRFRLHGRDLVVGVPGNFLVRADPRNSLIGPRLAAGLRRLVRDEELDVVLAYGNPAAHQMFSRIGFREMGRFHEYVDVRRSGTMLRRRFKGAAAVAPMIDAALGLRRWWRNQSRHRGVRNWQAREMCAQDVRNLDRSHWSEPRDRIVGAATGEYLASRFLQAPFSEYRVVGVFDGAGTVQALAVFSARRRAKVCECVTNPEALDVPTAIEIAVRALPDVHAVMVPTLPDSQVAAELKAGGYFGREPRDPVAARSWWSAYWCGDHPLANDLADPARWTLFFGSTHY